MKIILLNITLFLLAISAASAQVLVDTNCVPPLDTNVAYLSQYHVQAAGGLIDLNDVIHYGFSQCTNPPSYYSVDSFSSTVDGNLSLDGGTTFVHVSAPCQTKVSMLYLGTFNDTSEYSTEMMKLNMSGGTLPAGYMVRESPTLISPGSTKILPVGDKFEIWSYFNIYIELSNNYGAFWIPADSVAHVELENIHTGIQENNLSIQSISAAPNPFSDETVFHFSVAEAGDASLKICNTAGKEIETIFEGFAIPHYNYTAFLSAADLPPDIYLYELRTAGKISVGKVVLVK